MISAFLPPFAQEVYPNLPLGFFKMEKIIFKSTPEIWRKEYLGLKPNTIRLIELEDERLKIIKDFIAGKINIVDIEIINTETGEYFIRRLIDVTKFNTTYILSWKHELT